ncbi:protein disulfide isomerase PDI1 [Kluyveromyces lactis]|uniref:Protein disulfide-isomerase n=2 Tax=Kluyveromyces lactis TaxID=28985 RepID=F2Z6F2_KLULA|nr:uncharacterized protein KLLA0_C01111g [Kluyveromyces lactis]CAB51612.1 protein disulfide isomerase [Kluyveromyces lactis]CAH01095.1 KLLA0C01111p [Kluyveromyces lactis]|eukprot:XP_452244.1 uncharacterized protein KLLA0_C01111g [Kluyveromyces lactis]
MLFKNTVRFGLAALMAASCSAQGDAVAPEDSAVVKLDADTFHEFIKEHPLVLAEFFAPWCGHCKTLAPEYVKAADELESKDIPLAQIDCQENQQFCQEQGIPGYPSLKLFKNGNPEAAGEYQGGRDAKAIVNYMLKQSEPAVQVVEDEKAFNEIIAKNLDNTYVVDGSVPEFNETFYQVADSLRDDYSFIQHGSDGKLSIYLPGESEPIVYEGEDFDAETISTWIAVEAFPYFGDVNGETYQAYMAVKVPLAYFFYTSPEEREEYESHFVDLAKKFRGKVNFAGLDASKFGRHAENLNQKQQFPLFAIHDTIKDLKYGLPQLADEEFAALEKPITLATEEITKFVEDFLEGKAEPIVKSEEIPEIQENSVFKIVGKNHEEIVRDPKKDVLVEYYAPWCGHCKKLAPTYESMAEFAHENDELKDKVLIAKIDATANDVQSVEIPGFPVLYLWPAGEETEPILFEGPRTAEAFLAFIKENGSHGVDGLALYEEYLVEVEKKKQEEEEAQKAKEVEEVAEEDSELEQDEL